MRKYIVFIFCSLVFGTHNQAQEDGIKFLEAGFGEVLALAELEGKLVFVDAYTDWCTPCKKMDKDVFTDKAIGDFFNNNFLSVKVNMEEGEGVDLAKKYFVYAYPSLLFVDYDGTVAHRYAGFLDTKGLLSLGNTALDEGNNLEALAKRFEEGEREEAFLMQYLQASFRGGGGNHVAILEEYLNTQSDWSKPETQELIFTLLDQPQSKLFDYFIANKANFVKVYGETTVANKIQTLVYGSLSKGETPLSRADALFARAYPDKAKRLAAHYKMSYYQQKEDGRGYAQAAKEYVKNYPSIGLEELNDISWGFFDLVEDKKDLKKAIQWAKKSVKKDNSYLNNDTLAALYHKIGKSKKALKVAQNAVVLAQAAGEDYSTTSALIKEIQGGASK